MKKILYIGENSAVHQDLMVSGEDEVEQVKNVVGFHNQLERLDEFKLVVASQKLKGIKADELFHRYKNLLNEREIPFVIVHDHFDIPTRKRLLKDGVIDFVPLENGIQSIPERRSFWQEMLRSRLSIKEKTERPEYKIPLGKRIFDILVASFALLMLSPVFLVTIIAIRLESRGPIFYISKRVGTGYNVFDFYKFRSMYVDADRRLKEMRHLNQYKSSQESDSSESESESEDVEVPQMPRVTETPTLIHKDGTPISEEEYREMKRKQTAGTFLKFKDDPRITKVGAFIRNTSIDELPQIYNVLKGDMSIVGNRPLPLYEAEQLTSDDWGERFLAPAGITGLWQVEKRGQGEMSEEERKALDNRYAKSFSFWNDIRLILKTIPALFQKENV